MVSIKDIAKSAGVSVATVSNVLNDKGNVGANTKEKIIKLCREMDYYPNIMARKLKAAKTNTIMFCFSDFERSFYLRIIHGINDCMLENSIGIIICTHSTIGSFLRNGFVDGAIVLDKSINDKQIEQAMNRNMPIVVMDRLLELPYVSCVVSDNEASMAQLTECLLAKGYTRFNFVGGLVQTSDHQERYGTFQRVLSEHGVSFATSCYFQGDYSFKSGISAGNLIVMSGNLPEVVVCANDDMAAGVIQAFRENGVDVPGKVGVTGFDGEYIPNLTESFLTTAVVPMYDMGYLAAETLVKMMNGDIGPVIKKVKAPVTFGGSIL